MDTAYLTSNLHVWDVTLEGGATRRLLSTFAPSGFATPVIAATRGAAYAPGPDPAATSLLPTNAARTDPDVTLHVRGTGFRVGDEILWNGQPVPTTLVSPTELTTLVKMSTQSVGPNPVAVRALTGVVTAALVFDVRP